MQDRLRIFFTNTPNRRLLISGLLFVAAWRATLEVVNQLVSHLTVVIPYWPTYLKKVNGPANALPFGLGHWTHWDGYHFLGIIMFGYHRLGVGGSYSETAFFPAFPLLIRLLSRASSLDPVLVGLTVNIILSLVIYITIYKLAIVMCMRYMPKDKSSTTVVAWLSVLIFFLYPASFFLIAFYADALLVAMSVLALYFCLTRRYLFSALCGLIMVCTKSTGMVLLPTLMLIVLENEEVRNYRQLFSFKLIRKAAIVASGPVAGLSLYMLYLWRQFHDPLLFVNVERYWGRHNSISFLKHLYLTYYSHIFDVAHFGNVYQYVAILMIMALPFFTIGLAFWYCRTLNTYWVLVLTTLTMIVPLITGVMESLNRYALILAPLAVGVATLAVHYKVSQRLVYLLLLISAGLLCYFASGFLIGGYFAG